MSQLSDAEFVDGAYIQEGVSPAAGVVLAACTLGDNYDKPRNRIGLRKEGRWLEFGSSGEAVLSIDAAQTGEAYVMGENGTVIQFDWLHSADREQLRSSRKLIPNPAVAPKGPLRRLRVLGSDVVCVGSVGQAYRLVNGAFATLPMLAAREGGPTIEDIAGTNAQDMIAVTSDGYAAHFDGSAWSIVEFPTNASLTSICQLSDGKYAIAGKNGTLVVGSVGQWQVMETGVPDRSYWGVAAYAEQIYVAHLAGIDQLLGSRVSALSLPSGVGSLQFTVLRGSQDGVWSFAERTIGHIRDAAWTTLVA